MGLLQALRGSGYRANVPDPTSDFWYSPFSGATSSGVPVGPDTALRFSAVYACVRLLSESLAMLPLLTYEHTPDGGKRRAENHPIYDLLKTEPCEAPRTSAFTFKATAMVHLLLRGNAYAQIIPGPRGPVDQLKLIHPDLVTPILAPGAANLAYKVRQPDGTQKTVNNEDMLHLLGMSLDGLTGVSVITYARESIGLGLAAEGYAARVFSQDATPRGVLQMKGNLSTAATERLRASWQQQHGGLGNVHKPAILEEGLEWKTTAMTAEDAQLIGSREFEVEEIARWFNVPLHMVQSQQKTTSWGTGVAEMSLGFVIYSLMPWLTRWEDTVGQQLIVNNRRFFVEFLTQALLRGNLKDRYDAYTLGRNGGWLSVNDILRLENMNPIGPEGDVRLQPMNMVPLGTPPAPAAPPPPAAPSSPPRNGAAHLPESLKELVNGRHVPD